MSFNATIANASIITSIVNSYKRQRAECRGVFWFH
jgi:hypothetical protein